MVVVGPHRMLSRTFPASDSQVNIAKDAKNLFEVQQASALGLSLRWVSPFDEISPVPFQHSLGASHALRVCDFSYALSSIAV